MKQTNPISVTFDRNVYESILGPDKCKRPESNLEHAAIIANYIEWKQIVPYISESAFTLETLRNEKGNRRRILTKDRKIISEPGDSFIRLGGDPSIHPGTTETDGYFLNKAIESGFKILPIFRFGRIVNLEIRPEWRYIKEYSEPMGLVDKWSEVVTYLEDLGAGFGFINSLLKIPENRQKPWTFYAEQYTGSDKKFNRAIAEWSDGDSVASHIASGITYFCTYDEAKGAGSKSVFSPNIKEALNKKFGLKVVSPQELVFILQGHLPA